MLNPDYNAVQKKKTARTQCESRNLFNRKLVWNSIARLFLNFITHFICANNYLDTSKNNLHNDEPLLSISRFRREDDLRADLVDPRRDFRPLDPYRAPVQSDPSILGRLEVGTGFLEHRFAGKIWRMGW